MERVPRAAAAAASQEATSTWRPGQGREGASALLGAPSSLSTAGGYTAGEAARSGHGRRACLRGPPRRRPGGLSPAQQPGGAC